MSRSADLLLAFGATSALVGCSLLVSDDGYVGDGDAGTGGSTNVVDGGGGGGGGDATSTEDAGDASACAEGLVAADGGCVFVNPFRDPSFQAMPPDAWTTSKKAALDPTAMGPVDVGVASLVNDLREQGWVSQAVDVPPVSVVGPLALTVIAKTESATLGENDVLQIFVGDRIVNALLDVTKSPQTFVPTFCMGERAHGKGVPFRLLARNSEIDRLLLDRIALKQDATCPRPGVVVNGDFEGTGGWVASTTFAQIMPGIGTNASTGGRITSNFTATTLPKLTTALSVPAGSMTGPALTFRTYGTGSLDVVVANRYLARVQSNATRSTQSVCLPAWTRGITMNVALVGVQNDNATDVVVDVDDVAIVPSAACDDTAEVQNPGFETAGTPIPGWYATTGTGTQVTRKVNASLAHSGSSYLALNVPTCPSGGETFVSVTQTVSSPPSTAATGGPAARFFYKLSGSGLTAEGGGEPLANKSAWTLVTACLSPEPGARNALDITLRGTCAAGELDIDDVTVGNDPICFTPPP